MNSNKATIKGIYDQKSVAEQYIHTRFSRPLGAVQHRTQVQVVNDAIKRFNARSILEIACGPARLTAEISGFETGIAIDNSHEMLSIAKLRVPNTHHWTFLRADAFNFQIAQNFNLIYSFRFIRHFTLPNRKSLYANVRNLLAESGIFIFDAVHYEKPNFIKYLERKDGTEIYDHIYPSKQELVMELANAGFELVELKEVVRHFYLQAAISRVTHVLRIHGMGKYLIDLLEKLNYGSPLEWIVIWRKK